MPFASCQGGGCCRSAQSGNRAFCSEVTKWAFHERGVLRVTNLHHKCDLCPTLPCLIIQGGGSGCLFQEILPFGAWEGHCR